MLGVAWGRALVQLVEDVHPALLQRGPVQTAKLARPRTGKARAAPWGPTCSACWLPTKSATPSFLGGTPARQKRTATGRWPRPCPACWLHVPAAAIRSGPAEQTTESTRCAHHPAAERACRPQRISPPGSGGARPAAAAAPTCRSPPLHPAPHSRRQSRGGGLGTAPTHVGAWQGRGGWAACTQHCGLSACRAGAAAPAEIGNEIANACACVCVCV